MVRRAILLAVALAVAACGAADSGDVPDAYPLEPGFAATIDMAGQLYEMEVGAVDDGLATITYFWKDEPVSVRRDYRGLYALSGSDGRLAFSNDFDVTQIDALFPLEPGKEIAFAGRTSWSGAEAEGTLLVTMAVLESDEIAVDGERHPVFRIRVLTEMRVGGRTRTIVRLLSYAPELGLPLTVDTEEEGASSRWRVIAIDPPGRRRGNRLGTVMI